MTSVPLFPPDGNISVAWARSFCKVTQPGVAALTPLVVGITDFDSGQQANEVATIRNALDAALAQYAPKLPVDTAAGTIFPNSFWRPGVLRADLFDRYKAMIPRLRKHPLNRNGIYFERLIAFGNGPADGNQLEFILDCYQSGVRRKPALQATTFQPAIDLPNQAALFDPNRDQTKQRKRGFPCLQHVAFAPDSDHGTMSMSAFYASQYMFARAYGNYLGLCRLGRFMAHEMGLRLNRVTCYVGCALLDDKPGKLKLAGLRQTLVDLLAEIDARGGNVTPAAFDAPSAAATSSVILPANAPA